MSAPASAHDIFISYSRDDLEWVTTHLYQPLARCRFRSDGRRPRIFFDKSKEGIGVGQNWHEAIGIAVKQSPRVVPVYSPHYFKSEVCELELRIAQLDDIVGKRRKLTPVMLLRRGQEESSLAQLLPVTVSLINYLRTSDQDWLERLCEALDLVPETEQGVLEFLDQPASLPAKHTLPALRVAIESPGAMKPREESVTLSAEGCTLQGTLTAKTKEGVATFGDLSIGTPVGTTRLAARAEGLETVQSQAFAVLPEPPRRVQRRPPQIPCVGEAIFFANGRTLAVVTDSSVRLFNLAGQQLLAPPGEITLQGRLRLVRCAGPYLVLADWSGTIYLLGEDGASRVWPFGNGSAGFVVPGDIASDGQHIYVGFWAGAVWRLSLGDQPVHELHHGQGVQALTVLGGRLYVCGFDGNLWAYERGRQVNAHMLEPTIWRLKAYPGGPLAIGDEKIHRWKLQQAMVFSEKLPTAGVAGVLGEGDCPILIDAQGRGACYNSELHRVMSFHTTPGALPVGCDLSGRHCVLQNPDGSRTLLVQGRINFSYAGGTLAVAPAGDRFALGEREGIRILDAAAFGRLIRGEALDE